MGSFGNSRKCAFWDKQATAKLGKSKQQRRGTFDREEGGSWEGLEKQFRGMTVSWQLNHWGGQFVVEGWSHVPLLGPAWWFFPVERSSVGSVVCNSLCDWWWVVGFLPASWIHMSKVFINFHNVQHHLLKRWDLLLLCECTSGLSVLFRWHVHRFLQQCHSPNSCSFL